MAHELKKTAAEFAEYGRRYVAEVAEYLTTAEIEHARDNYREQTADETRQAFDAWGRSRPAPLLFGESWHSIAAGRVYMGLHRRAKARAFDEELRRRIANVPAVIALNAGEADIVAWAIDPMYDYWCRPDEVETIVPREPRAQSGEPIIAEAELPKIDGRWALILSPLPAVNADLAYRLFDQLADMTEEQLNGELLPEDGKPWADAMNTAKAIKSLRAKFEKFSPAVLTGGE